MITAFNVRPDVAARSLADSEKVEIRYYNVIYTLIEEMQKALLGLLDPEIVEVVDGQAEVREVYNQVRGQSVLGTIVREGTLRRGAQARILRDRRQLVKNDNHQLARFKKRRARGSERYEWRHPHRRSVRSPRGAATLGKLHTREKARV